jgi:hypothetical protein
VFRQNPLAIRIALDERDGFKPSPISCQIQTADSAEE